MKKQKIIIFIISIFLVSIAFLIDFLYRNSFLSRNIYKIVAEPLFYVGSSLFIVSIFYFFLKDEIFKPWIKFTYWWLPLSIILTLITPGGSGSFFVNIWDKEMTVIFMSAIYVVVSTIMLIINIIRFYLLNKNKTDII
jgi:hypothetical protein